MFGVSLVALGTPLAVALLPLVAFPIAAIFRIATRIVRHRSVSFWDGYRGLRGDLGPILAVGVGLSLVSLVFTVNVATGLASESPPGWAIATLAFWGLLAAWLFAWTVWPILLDPDRESLPRRARLRLAALLVLAHPVRIGALGLGIAVLLALSTVAVAPILTISVSLAGLWAAHVVLPAADRLEARLAARDAR